MNNNNSNEITEIERNQKSVPGQKQNSGVQMPIKTINNILKTNYIPSLVSQMKSSDSNVQFQAVQKFRSLLSQGKIYFNIKTCI